MVRNQNLLSNSMDIIFKKNYWRQSRPAQKPFPYLRRLTLRKSKRSPSWIKTNTDGAKIFKGFRQLLLCSNFQKGEHIDLGKLNAWKLRVTGWVQQNGKKIYQHQIKQRKWVRNHWRWVNMGMGNQSERIAWIKWLPASEQTIPNHYSR